MTNFKPDGPHRNRPFCRLQECWQPGTCHAGAARFHQSAWSPAHMPGQDDARLHDGRRGRERVPSREWTGGEAASAVERPQTEACRKERGPATRTGNLSATTEKCNAQSAFRPRRVKRGPAAPKTPCRQAGKNDDSQEAAAGRFPYQVPIFRTGMPSLRLLSIRFSVIPPPPEQAIRPLGMVESS